MLEIVKEGEMDQELIKLFEEVKKAADLAAAANCDAQSSPEEDRCLDALRLLKKYPVNYQILVSTQVGKRLRYLTKHPRKKIQALASDVVEIWKGIIVEETSRNTKNANLNGKGSVKVEAAGAESSEHKKVQNLNSAEVEERIEHRGVLNSSKSVKAETSAEKKFKNFSVVKNEKKTAGEHVKVEKTKKEEKQTDLRKPVPTSMGLPRLASVIYCKDALRDKVRELLSEALCKVLHEVDDDLCGEVNTCDPFRVAVSVESAMFEKWGRSNGAQKFKYRSIMFNIKDPNNPDFRRKVLRGHFAPESIVNLTAEDMASDQRQKQNEKIKEKALFECERGLQQKASTDQFQCGRCKQRKCTYFQLQTRSADEPMTTFVTCVNCNNHWKFC